MPQSQNKRFIHPSVLMEHALPHSLDDCPAILPGPRSGELVEHMCIPVKEKKKKSM